MPTKAVAAGGTAAVAGALTTIILSAFDHPVSPDLAGAIQTVVTAALSFCATWFTKAEGSGS